MGILVFLAALVILCWRWLGDIAHVLTALFVIAILIWLYRYVTRDERSASRPRQIRRRR